jgi:3-hydroxyisobutyrate dehydrogenase-like beta-hydroxyacid dehydrogenase
VSTIADRPRIGWIGLGKMGLPICERLAAHAFLVTALTRSEEHRERIARVGVRSASAIAGAVDGAGSLCPRSVTTRPC